MYYIQNQNIWDLPDDRYGKNAVILHAITPIKKVYLANKSLLEADALFSISLDLEQKKDDPDLTNKAFENLGIRSWETDTGHHNAYLLLLYYKQKYNEHTNTGMIQQGIRQINDFVTKQEIKHVYLTRLYDYYTQKTNEYSCIDRRWNRIQKTYEYNFDQKYTMIT